MPELVTANSKASGAPRLDMTRLLEARLYVARLGESELSAWWRTDNVLGTDGAFVGPRVLPKTHPVGRARIAMAVASHACQERYRDPNALHLFTLDAWTEDQLDAYLHSLLHDFAYWHELMERLEAIEAGAEPTEIFIERKLVTEEAIDEVANLPLGPDSRSLRLPSGKSPEQVVELMTAGFVRGRRSELVVPYVPREEWPENE